jgi:3',5'-cyclic AMP phosphodiesterase CpdA
MRILHMTDVHFLQPPPIKGLLGKRALGMANLYLAGRKSKFDATTLVGLAVDDALQWDADLFVFTGDLTALAVDREFVQGHQAFAPLLETMPSIMIPGNHDTYTREATRAARMEHYLGAYMAGGQWNTQESAWSGAEGLRGGVDWPVEFRLGDTTLVATNPCRPSLRATGRFGSGALRRAEAMTQAALGEGRQVVYLLHYPPLARDGSPYTHSGHCLEDVDELLASLRRAPPSLVLHGHKHDAWRVDLQVVGSDVVPIFNCGTTSAVSTTPSRTAGYFIYDLQGGQLRSVRRRMLLAGAGRFVDDSADFGVAV